MTIEEYLNQHIDSNAIKMAKDFVESSQYKEIQKLIGSETYKIAQEALKARDSLIHKDTLIQIKRLQEQIQSSGVYTISEDQIKRLKSEQEAIRKMVGNLSKQDG